MVDIDVGSLSINPEIGEDSRSSRSSEYDCAEDMADIPDIPEGAAKLFLNVCHKAKFQFDLVDTRRWEYLNKLITVIVTFISLRNVKLIKKICTVSLNDDFRVTHTIRNLAC